MNKDQLNSLENFLRERDERIAVNKTDGQLKKGTAAFMKEIVISESLRI